MTPATIDITFKMSVSTELNRVALIRTCFREVELLFAKVRYQSKEADEAAQSCTYYANFCDSKSRHF